MHIANPIYDVVFKYLLDDNRIARMLLSAIIGEQIEELSYRPQERRIDVERKVITVYRLDFTARIRTAAGCTKQVIIEIQKAKFATDIMRFRKYLGEQYISADNVLCSQSASDTKQWYALPIISIYFLGYSLAQTKASVIKVSRTSYDLITGEQIPQKEEFIESLTHDSYIIQIPYLKDRRMGELGLLLSIFDQSSLSSDHHIKNINEEDFPEKYRLVIRRLQKAASEPQVRDTMDMEDEILEELENLERTIEAKDKELERKDKALEENKRIIEENRQKLEENKRNLEEKDALIRELKKKIGDSDGES